MVNNTKTATTALLLVGVALLSAGAQADGFGDDMATPLACTTWEGGGTVSEAIDNKLDHGECASGSEACHSAEAIAERDALGALPGGTTRLELILDHSGADCEGTSKCNPGWMGRTWAVEGGYKEGSGTVQFWIQCGADESDPDVQMPDIICDVSDVVECKDGPEEDKGEFGCWYAILSGSPKEIWGKCVDPADPTVIYQAVPIGIEDYNVFEHAQVR